MVFEPQQIQTGTYHTFYFPDGSPSPDPDSEALYADPSHPLGDVRTYLYFRDILPGGLVAGGNIEITPAQGSPTIDVDSFIDLNPVSTAVGTVSVDANGSIGLLETIGTMRVGTIISEMTPATDPFGHGVSVTLVALSSDITQTGLDISLNPAASITAQEGIQLLVENDFDMAAGATIFSPTYVYVETDFDVNNPAEIASGKGSTVQIAGAITTPSETIQQGASSTPLADTISLTNVQSGTTALIETAAGQNEINLGSLAPTTAGYSRRAPQRVLRRWGSRARSPSRAPGRTP